jgi:hypothetical protein
MSLLIVWLSWQNLIKRSNHSNNSRRTVLFRLLSSFMGVATEGSTDMMITEDEVILHDVRH